MNISDWSVPIMHYGGNKVEPTDTFESLDMEEGSSIRVVLPRIENVIAEMLQGNADATREQLTQKLKLSADGETVEYWILQKCGLENLPSGFSALKFSGNLNLHGNALQTLPVGFEDMTIGGILSLSGNRLHTLPENFSNIKVGKHLNLDYNELTTLPAGFGNMNIPGNLLLSHNNLQGPITFQNISVGGLMSLDHNHLDVLVGKNLKQEFPNVVGTVTAENNVRPPPPPLPPPPQ